MRDDVIIKLILAIALCFMYGLVFLAQKLDIATVVSLVTAFTNALVGIFSYNLGKKKKKRDEEEI